MSANGNGKVLFAPRHVATQKMVDSLKGAGCEAVITADRLKEVNGGFDVRTGTRGRCYLTSAIRILEREFGIVWRWMRQQDCIKRLEGLEIDYWGDGQVRGVGRKLKRTVRALGCVDMGVLNDEERTQHLTRMAQTGTLHGLSQPKARKLFAEHQITKPAALPKLLEALKTV